MSRRTLVLGWRVVLIQYEVSKGNDGNEGKRESFGGFPIWNLQAESFRGCRGYVLRICRIDQLSLSLTDRSPSEQWIGHDQTIAGRTTHDSSCAVGSYMLCHWSDGFCLPTSENNRGGSTSIPTSESSFCAFLLLRIDKYSIRKGILVARGNWRYMILVPVDDGDNLHRCLLE